VTAGFETHHTRCVFLDMSPLDRQSINALTSDTTTTCGGTAGDRPRSDHGEIYSTDVQALNIQQPGEFTVGELRTRWQPEESHSVRITTSRLGGLRNGESTPSSERRNPSRRRWIHDPACSPMWMILPIPKPAGRTGCRRRACCEGSTIRRARASRTLLAHTFAIQVETGSPCTVRTSPRPRLGARAGGRSGARPRAESFVPPGLLGQVGEHAGQVLAGVAQPGCFGGSVEHDLGDGQADQFGVGELFGSAGPWPGDQLVVGEAVQHGQQGVQVSIHRVSMIRLGPTRCPSQARRVLPAIEHHHRKSALLPADPRSMAADIPREVPFKRTIGVPAADPASEPTRARAAASSGRTCQICDPHPSPSSAHSVHVLRNRGSRS
jgi:hypothetical protein